MTHGCHLLARKLPILSLYGTFNCYIGYIDIFTIKKRVGYATAAALTYKSKLYCLVLLNIKL